MLLLCVPCPGATKSVWVWGRPNPAIIKITMQILCDFISLVYYVILYFLCIIVHCLIMVWNFSWLSGCMGIKNSLERNGMNDSSILMISPPCRSDLHLLSAFSFSLFTSQSSFAIRNHTYPDRTVAVSSRPFHPNTLQLLYESLCHNRVGSTLLFIVSISIIMRKGEGSLGCNSMLWQGCIYDMIVYLALKLIPNFWR